ncbi:Histone deacetylase-like amidohydrolase [Thalassoglobus neptunius]|uniref:Histone deacetylase-like amidohydrolase n=1 Tax=Thalassoglobus neptunius TaxID=1938619 RepID=A0A5C5W004_9PLAN|nr:histone deacetylase [Thalassoglobus neptunius]TWT43082.1 Histone deacetylase-like amidohydrolase [Thalassoglobus neptunius]
MTSVFTSERFEDHLTGTHPENPIRISVLLDMLRRKHEASHFLSEIPTPVSEEFVLKVHEADYLKELKRTCRDGGGRLDPDTVASPESYSTALLAAGAACNAVDRVISGEAANALCLIRPPGHHAVSEHAMGFCLLNNVAIAARYAQAQFDLSRIMIIDWDVHHGNGTQDIFFEDETVMFCSIHRHPFYPGTGTESETGTGRGLGTTLNVPLPFGTPRETYFERFRGMVERAVSKSKPELVLISAGFDAHVDDPVGSLGLETEDFQELTKIVTAMAATECDGRVVSLLEGGYQPQALAESVAVHLDGLIAASAQ